MIKGGQAERLMSIHKIDLFMLINTETSAFDRWNAQLNYGGWCCDEFILRMHAHIQRKRWVCVCVTVMRKCKTHIVFRFLFPLCELTFQ